MTKIQVVTKTRGFLTRLFESDLNEIEFIYERNKVYDTKSRLRICLFKLVQSKIGDYLGIIQRLKASNEHVDYYFSYNRFLKTNKKYVIYLENPLALVHYSTGRYKTYLGKKRLKKLFDDSNLMAIVCLSKACYETLQNFYEIPSRIEISQIYPLVEINKLVDENSINDRCHSKVLNCLYISSNFNLKGGKDILKCFDMLKDMGNDRIKLKIITQIDSLDENIKQSISENENISLHDFRFKKEELEIVYSESSILINPSRQDSFSLVVLEAIKAGNVVLSSDLYGIPEMVLEGSNGYLISPKYRYFNYNNMPNEKVWSNLKGTIKSDYIDELVVEFLFEKLNYLEKNRKVLEEMSMNSYNKAINKEFSEECISSKWMDIFKYQKY